MKQTSLFLIVLLLLVPQASVAGAQDPPIAAGDQDVNVNSRYVVEDVSFQGIDESAISKSLRADARKLVGQKFDQDAVNRLAERLRKENRGYSVDVKVRRAEKVDHVKVGFHFQTLHRNALYMQASPVVYQSKEGFSAVLGAAFETHHNYVSANWTSTADELLERNEGYRLRYEHRRVGTDLVQLGVQFDRFHPLFKAPTQASLALSPEVPGAYRRRQNFAPSVSVLPVNGVKFTVGLSLQNLDFDVPGARTERAYAFTADAEVQRKVTDEGGYRHAIGVGYSFRKAATALESDFVYTRHLVAGDYTLSRHRHLFGVHGRLGTIEGTAPLFERFSLGNSFLLRGWDKFDVAPLGGSRLAYGSLEYRYRPFQVFWDFGSVWDAGQTIRVRHSIGIGVVSRDTPVGGWFASVAFPVRLNDVGAVVMFGVRR